jgi:enoyl-CoA hydratase / long-chain 3-hydroxyacyl-CoA dehydrogenase
LLVRAHLKIKNKSSNRALSVFLVVCYLQLAALRPPVVTRRLKKKKFLERVDHLIMLFCGSMLLRCARFRSGGGVAQMSMARAMSSDVKEAKKPYVESRDGDVAILALNMPTGSVNTLRSEFARECFEALKSMQEDPSIRAIVLTSAKKGNFIAGADIGELRECSSSSDAAKLSREGHAKFGELERFKKPVVAAIDGACLGGGLEFALACHYRVATTSGKTVLGLPEVKLGLMPGAGGTQRLPRLVGLPAALDMMLKGGDVRPKKAKKIGLVDAVCDPAALHAVAVQAARDLADGKLVPPRKLGLVNAALAKVGPLRNVALQKAREAVMKSTGGKYPAPLAIIDVVRVGLQRGIEAGYDAEAEQFGLLSQTSEADGLMSIFSGMQAIKTTRYGAPSRRTEKMAMIGAGLMGAGIAHVSAQKARLDVVLYDANEAGLARGRKQIHDSLEPRVRRRIMTSFERDAVMSRIVPVTPGAPSLGRHLADCDLIIEAVPEQLELKHRVLGAIERQVPQHCVIASNTSALPIADVAAGLSRPERVVGMHYFSPVDKMPLLEVIVTDKTSREAAAVAVDVGQRQGKQVIVVKDKAGFYTTRILAAFMPEVAPLIAEGVELGRLDSALRSWGFPVGPITLMDEVGLDVGAHIGRDLGAHFGERVGPAQSMRLLEGMVERGLLGRKSGRGFYVYPQQQAKGKAKKAKKTLNPDVQAVVDELRAGQAPASPDDITDEHIQERMALRMINEAVYCLDEGVLDNPIDGDIGAVFGLGFPPFYGGPFRYIDQQGANVVLGKLDALRERYGDRFEASPMLRRYAESNTRFHEQ